MSVPMSLTLLLSCPSPSHWPLVTHVLPCLLHKSDRQCSGLTCVPWYLPCAPLCAISIFVLVISKTIRQSIKLPTFPKLIHDDQGLEAIMMCMIWACRTIGLMLPLRRDLHRYPTRQRWLEKTAFRSPHFVVWQKRLGRENGN